MLVLASHHPLPSLRRVLSNLQEAHKGPDGGLKSRLLFHLAHRMNHESKLLMYHSKLSDTQEDQLSLAAIHFMRAHYQEVSRPMPCLPPATYNLRLGDVYIDTHHG